MRKKTHYLFIATIIIFNILIRFTQFPFSRGGDNYHHFWRSTSIISTGTAHWFLDPLSLFGLYPFSRPYSISFLVSIMSMVSGISVEGGIFIVGYFFGILGMMGYFVWSREITRNNKVVYLGMFFLGTSFYFLSYYVIN